jgi:hypothetical protein
VQGNASRAYYTRLLENAGERPTAQLESSVQSTMTASVSNQGQGSFFFGALSSLYITLTGVPHNSRRTDDQLLPRRGEQGPQGGTRLSR